MVTAARPTADPDCALPRLRQAGGQGEEVHQAMEPHGIVIALVALISLLSARA